MPGPSSVAVTIFQVLSSHMWPVASYPVEQCIYRIFLSLKYILLASARLEELQGTPGARFCTYVRMGSHCSYSQGILSSKELFCLCRWKNCLSGS